MKKSSILEILTPMLKYERKKIKKYVFSSEIIQIINKIAAL